MSCSFIKAMRHSLSESSALHASPQPADMTDGRGIVRPGIPHALPLISSFNELNPAYAEEQEKALNFGIISTESQQNLKPQWTPFLQDMEKKLGVKVNALFAPDYAGIIQGMRFNKVDIAWYGNLSAMEAVDRANG